MPRGSFLAVSTAGLAASAFASILESPARFVFFTIAWRRRLRTRVQWARPMRGLTVRPWLLHR